MKRPRHTMRRYTWALAILCFLVILLAAPLLVSDRYNRIALQSGAVFAASTNSYSLSTPVRLMTGPTIELESGTLSVPPSRTGLARGGQMIAMLITGNGPQMTLDKATFTADFSTREPTFSQDAGAGDVAPLVQGAAEDAVRRTGGARQHSPHQDVGRLRRRTRAGQCNDLVEAERRYSRSGLVRLPRRDRSTSTRRSARASMRRAGRARSVPRSPALRSPRT